MISSPEPIVIAANLVPFRDLGQQQRQELCISSINKLINANIQPLNICFPDEFQQPPGWDVLPTLARSANQELRIEGKRKPFVSDLFDAAATWATEHNLGAFMLSNSDIFLTEALLTEVRRLLASGHETIAISRNEVEQVDSRGHFVPGYLEINGYDVFVCKTDWWQKNRFRFQPYIFGERAWDDAYATIMACHSRFVMLYQNGLCFHFKHETTWLTGPYADYNMGLYQGIDKPYSDRYEAFIAEVIQTDKARLTAEKTNALRDKYFTLHDTTARHEERSRMVNIGIMPNNPMCLSPALEPGQPRDKMPRPMVSVIVPTFNRPEFLAKAIKSILAQSYRNFEILVVNDGGADVSSVIEQLNPAGQIRYFNLPVTIDRSAARNHAIRAAKGKYIAYLDDDDFFYPDHLATLVNLLESSEYQVAYSDACRVTQEKDGESYVDVSADYPYSEDFDENRMLTENFIPILCIMHEKSCIESVGFFDETLNRHEDWDLWIRMSRAYPFVHIKKVTCGFTSRPDGSGTVTGAVPSFLRSFDAICAKYRYLTADRPEILSTQQRQRYFMLCDVYSFLLQKLEANPGIAASLTPSNQIVGYLTSLGATAGEAASAFYQKKAMNAAELPPQAISFFLQALQRDPENVLARQQLAATLFKTGEHAQAVEHLHCLLQANPLEPTITKMLALYYWGKDDPQAAELSKKLLALTPNDSEIRDRLAGYLSSAPATGKPLTVAVFSLDAPEYACAQIRLLAPYQHLQHAMRSIWGAIFKGKNCTTNLDAIAAADLIVIQRFYPRQGSVPYIDQMLASGKPVIYELDDLITDVPDDHYLKPWIAETSNFFPSFLPRIAAVTVSTPQIADAVRPYAKKVYLLPNLIDETIWRTVSPKYSSTPIVIGFAGTATHRSDMAEIEPALFRIAAKYGDKVAFRFMGDVTDTLRTLPGFSFIPFAEDYRSYAQSLGQSGFDIAIVPLLDNSFNRAKSNIKWLEYSICGIAGIYADLPPYNSCIKQGETGILVANDPERWFQAISLLIDSADLRHAIATKAQQEVLTHHSLRTGAVRWLNVYNEIIAQQHAPSPHTCQVSIIIPVFNQLAFTRQCLEALAKTLPPVRSCEIIVIDNGSQDATPAYLRSLGSQVHMIQNRENIGFARACNQGAAAAQGDTLIFLNNDTIPQTGWLPPLLDALSQTAADICGARLLYPDGRCQHAGIAFDVRGLGYHIFGNFPGDAPPVMESRHMQAVTGACLAISKRLFTELNGFDEGFRNGFEDVDLCLRAGAMGKRILYVPESLVVHFAEQSSGRKDHDTPNMQRFFDRWQGKVRADDQELYRRFNLICRRTADGRISVAPDNAPAPAVSIIIPLFNRMALTQSCLQAIERATVAGSYELILVDNGSTDGTSALLDRWANKATVVRNLANAGFAKACNQGARCARGAYLLFLNNDTEVVPGWLEPLQAILDQDPMVGAVGSKLLYPNRTIQHAGVVLLDDQSVNDPLLAKNQYVGFPHDHPPANIPRRVQALSAACLMIRRNAYDSAGGFDEGYWNGYEDVDLCLQLGKIGWTLVYQPQSVIVHHESQSGAERFSQASANIGRLHVKWSGKTKVDAIVLPTGKLQLGPAALAGSTGTYHPPLASVATKQGSSQGYVPPTYALIPLVGHTLTSPLQKLASSKQVKNILKRYSQD